MYIGHSISHGNFFSSKNVTTQERENIRLKAHVVNVIIRWGYIYSSAPAFGMVTSLFHSADTVKNVLWHWGRKCYNTFPILPTLCSIFTLYATMKQ
jgi:hypothetical protein